MKRPLLAALLFALTSSTAATAQIWDAPMFFAPRPMDDLGLYYVRTNGSLRDASGLKAIWRQSGNLNLGVHAGIGDLDNAGNTIMVGAELYGGLNSLLPGSGIDISWNLGAGATFGDDYTYFTVPFGASLGLRLGSGSVQVQPYVHPRISLDILAVGSGAAERTDTEGSVAVDLGADVNLGPRWVLRGAYSLADRDAFGIGLAMRWPRGVSVVR